MKKTTENQEPKNKGGAPTTYTIEIAERICEEVAAGRPICDISKDDWAPAERTVYGWLNRHEEFVQLYAHARERQQELYAAEVIKIADTEPDPQRARNRMDARRWYAGKVSPRKWGDRVGVDVEAKVELTATPSEALATLLSKLGGVSNG